VDPACRFQAHGAHTYEHLRPLLVALYTTGNPGLEAALDGYLAKLEPCLTPSGGPIGDEDIAGQDADATATGYEYCSIHELFDSYMHLFQKSGETRWGDRAEWLLFNAGQGARHPRESAISYLRTDNSASLTGPLYPGDPPAPQGPQTRYKFSPAHQDAAVCCVPNAGRIYPYYVKAMWLRSAAGLIAALYGPCEVQTEVNGVPVRIREETSYPFDLHVHLTVEVAEPIAFELALRLPGWVTDLTLSGANAKASDGWVTFHQTWSGCKEVALSFAAAVAVHTWKDNERFVSWGPLVFALPLGGEARAGREYAPGFADIYYWPTGNAEEPAFPAEPGFDLIRRPFDLDRPWESLELAGQLLECSGRKPKTSRLIPMGGTILRRVTFPSAESKWA
jgi:hypothetical protein